MEAEQFGCVEQAQGQSAWGASHENGGGTSEEGRRRGGRSRLKNDVGEEQGGPSVATLEEMMHLDQGTNGGVMAYELNSIGGAAYGQGDTSIDVETTGDGSATAMVTVEGGK